jgi:hypothetical protein
MVSQRLLLNLLCLLVLWVLLLILLVEVLLWLLLWLLHCWHGVEVTRSWVITYCGRVLDERSMQQSVMIGQRAAEVARFGSSASNGLVFPSTTFRAKTPVMALLCPLSR